MAAAAIKNGFTLVELLIAMTIMLALLVLTGSAFQLYNNVLQRDLSKIETTYQSFRHTELLLDAVQAILPLAVTEQGSRAYYFLGREEGFTAVTYAPIYHVGYPAVIRVFREINESGKYRLVYEEASLKDVVLKDAAQDLPFNFRLVIADDLDMLGFSYFGWSSLTNRVAAITDFSAGLDYVRSWFLEYDALTRQLHPEKVKVTINTFELEFSVADRSRVNAFFSLEEAL